MLYKESLKDYLSLIFVQTESYETKPYSANRLSAKSEVLKPVAWYTYSGGSSLDSSEATRWTLCTTHFLLIC